MQTEISPIFLNSPLILSLKLLGVFPIDLNTLGNSYTDIFYSSILIVLSIFELSYTPVFIMIQTAHLFPGNFLSTSTARFMLSCVSAMVARLSSIFLMKKFFPLVNEALIISSGSLNTPSVARNAFERERSFYRTKFACQIVLFVLIFVDSARLHSFIKQSDCIGHTIFFIYYIVFQNWSIICFDTLFLTIAQQLNLNFLRMNVQLESILEDTEFVKKEGMSRMSRSGKNIPAKIENNWHLGTVAQKRVVAKSPYFWPEVRKISDNLLEPSILNAAPVKLPTTMHDQIVKIHHLHILCSKGLEALNSLFQVHILFSLLRLFCVSFVVVYQHISRYVEYGCVYTTLIYVYIFVIIFRFIIVVVAADLTTTQAQYTKVLISKINNRFLDADTKEELELFWNHITSSKLEFTACGFFTLNTRLIASAFVAGTTYLVILLQFNPEKPAIIQGS